MARRYWLLKSEPDVYSIDDLAAEPRGIARWDEIRNYQARNLLRDELKTGDLGFMYQSACSNPGITGIVRVVREAYPDPLQFDPESRYCDPKSDPESPRWYCVDIEYVCRLDTVISLRQIRGDAALADMVLVRQGRLSVQPVSADEWRHLCAVAGVNSRSGKPRKT